jgi:hypothetical protein
MNASCSSDIRLLFCTTLFALALSEPGNAQPAAPPSGPIEAARVSQPAGVRYLMDLYLY